MKNNIAIIGATGAVGRKILETLHLRKFPLYDIETETRDGMDH